MTILILEGCDGAGKTTLAEELQRLSGFEIVKGSSFEISKLGEEGMYQHMTELLDRKNIIIDRFYMSNYVYGQLYGYPTMNSMQFATLSKKTGLKALTVYVSANKGTLKDRITMRGDKDIAPFEVERILDKYSEAMHNWSTFQSSILHINSTLADVHKSAPMVLEFAKMQERKTYMYYHL